MADEQIDTVTQAFLGTTVACARCHDHKFDPIPQRDYYALAGIFLSTETCFGTAPNFQNTRSTPLIELPSDCGLPRMPRKLSSLRRKALEKELAGVERYAAIQFYGTAVQSLFQGKRFNVNNDPKKLVLFVGIYAKIGEIKSELNRFESDGKEKLLAMGVRDFPITPITSTPQRPTSIMEIFKIYSGRPPQLRSIRDSAVYARGDAERPGESVPRGFLSLIGPPSTAIAAKESGRRELAEWLVSPDHPLTSRVFVNRVWHWLFGKGLVESVDNFGTTGHLPSNQDLLDYLAVQFQTKGWSVKSLIREIMLSHVYQLSSDYEESNFARDPEDAWLWRVSPRRLEAECIRDAMLAVGNQLDAKPPTGSLVASHGDGCIGGYPIKSLRAPLSDDLFLKANHHFRSVYLPVPRNAVPDTLTVFDFTEPNTVSGAREVTTVPSQALYLLNNDFVSMQAKRFAERLMSVEERNRIDIAFQLAFSRSPTDSETPGG